MPGLRLGLTIHESNANISRQATIGTGLLTSQLWMAE
jgi:hypothetical protein